MRILAGEHRGRPFKSVPKSLPVKPISSRIKKSLFDILRPWLAGAKSLGAAGKGRTSYGDILQDLSWIPYRAGVTTFDVIFLGPPYRDEEDRPLHYSTPSLARVIEANLPAEGGIVLVQHHVKEEVQVPVGWERWRREKYGDTFMDFHRRAATPAP
jgi:16S rRNA (guanine966-N2)-methyltransferase